MRTHCLSALVALLVFNGVNLESTKESSGTGNVPAHVRRLLVKRAPGWRNSAPAQFAHPPAPAAPSPTSYGAGRTQRSEANERWARFIAEYAGRGDARINPLPGWAKDAVMVDLPLAAKSEGLPSSVPVLVLPVPVPFQDSRRECEVRQDEPERFDLQRVPARPSRPVVVADEPLPPRPAPTPAVPASRPRRPQPQPQQRPQQQPYQQPATPPTPQLTLSSHELVELFRQQQPSSPQMPPVLVRDRRYDVDDDPAPAPSPSPTPYPAHAKPGPGNAYLPPLPYTPTPQNPPQPVFDRPLMLRGELTVYRADYTEAYMALWDHATGAARVDMHGGSMTSYRTMTGNGRVRRATMTLDRSSGDREVVRCAVMRDSALLPSDKIPPVLPDTSNFSFGGYIDYGNVSAEMWRHTESGGAGQMGAARGEALAFRHELLLARAHDQAPTPLQYSVAVDSSMLGPDCDGYVHRYHEVRETNIEPRMFEVDLEKTCESMEETKDMSLVEPLLEFTMKARDPRHDKMFNSFTSQFERKYQDAAEEAVRKNLFTQTSRFISSANRIGATFEMGLNFLSDRLDAELMQLLGVVQDAEHFPAELFPHERGQLRDLEAKLPDEFDWREKGGVSSVRYQGASCSSCWAFAVTGAVEGALFRATRKLVPLSEQCLVDCAQPYGGRGCGGTWPSHAYDYVQDRGLPALDEYTPYSEKVTQCRDKEVPPVTQISAHVNVTAFSVPALKVAIRKHAPTVVIVDAFLKSFTTYKSGVFYDDRCAKVKSKLKHAVLAVGWGVRGDEPHFILKNSWSAAWGDGGYIRVHGPSNTCGVLTLPSYPRLEKDDVRRLPGAAAAPDDAAITDDDE